MANSSPPPMSRLASTVGDMFCGCNAPPSGSITGRSSGVRHRPSNDKGDGDPKGMCFMYTVAVPSKEGRERQKDWDDSHPWVKALDEKPQREAMSPRHNASGSGGEDEYADLPAMVEHAIKRQMSGKRVVKSSVAHRLTLLAQPDSSHNVLFNLKVVDMDPRAQ